MQPSTVEQNKDELTPKQELFCHIYTHNRQLFGNATLSYAEAYDYGLDELSQEKPVLGYDSKGEPNKWGESEYTKAYNVCSAQGSRLLRNQKIDDRIRELMNLLMRDSIVDAELISIVLHGEKDSDRVAAIKEYNKLKQRILDKVDHTTGGEKIIGINYVIPGQEITAKDIGKMGDVMVVKIPDSTNEHQTDTQ